MGAGTWRRLDGGAPVVPLRGGIRAATDISSGCLDPVYARFGSVQKPGVVGLARRALEPGAPRGICGELKEMGLGKRRDYAALLADRKSTRLKSSHLGH